MRFNHALLFMMGVAALSAFVMPPGLGNSLRKVDVLLAPVSYPVRQLAARFHARVDAPRQTPGEERRAAAGGRTYEQLRDENETLKFRVAQLMAENAELEGQLTTIAKIGLSADELVPAAVIGGDPGSQQVLSIRPSSTEGMTSRMPVITPEKKQMAGRLEIVGIGATRVRLITDRTSTVAGAFKRYRQSGADFESMPQGTKVLRGSGDGKMVISGVKAEEVKPPGDPAHALAPGDWLVVNDADFPQNVQGFKLGEIESIDTGKNALFYNVVVRPDQDLMKLREVMIVVKK